MPCCGKRVIDTPFTCKTKETTVDENAGNAKEPKLIERLILPVEPPREQQLTLKFYSRYDWPYGTNVPEEARRIANGLRDKDSCCDKRYVKRLVEVIDDPDLLPLSPEFAQTRPVTVKFYARHDLPYRTCTAEEIERMSKKLEAFKRDSNTKYKKRTMTPETTNQMYGWYESKAEKYPRSLNGIFNFPHVNDPTFEHILKDNMLKCRLIVAQMSNSRCDAYHWMTPLFVVSIGLSLLMPCLERPALYFLLIATTLTHWHYGTRVVNQMCEHFNRICFGVKPRHPPATKSSDPAFEMNNETPLTANKMD